MIGQIDEQMTDRTVCSTDGLFSVISGFLTKMTQLRRDFMHFDINDADGRTNGRTCEDPSKKTERGSLKSDNQSARAIEFKSRIGSKGFLGSFLRCVSTLKCTMNQCHRITFESERPRASMIARASK